MEEYRANLRDIESINNLDTARMTLRWALERMRLLENSNSELSKKAVETEKTLFDTHKELQTLKAVAEIRAQSDAQKDIYNERLEEVIAEYCKGEIGAPELSKKKAELESLRREQLDQSRKRLEQELSIKRARLAESNRTDLDEKYETLKGGLRSSNKTEIQAKALGENLRQWEKDLVTREDVLREAQTLLQSKEQALEKRKALQERDFLERKSDLEQEYDRLKDKLAQSSRLNLEAWRKERELHEAKLAEAWEMERDDLGKQARAWETQAHQHLLHIIELEERVLKIQSEAFYRLEALESKFNKKMLDMGRRKEFWEQESARTLEAVHKWRAELEDTMAARSRQLETRSSEHSRIWIEREKERAARGERQEAMAQEIEQKLNRVSELKRRLSETISDYQNRLKGLQTGNDKVEQDHGDQNPTQP